MKICLWEERSRRRYSLSQLSEMSGISRSTLNNIENGRTSPNVKQLEAKAKAMRIEIVDLFDSNYKYGPTKKSS